VYCFTASPAVNDDGGPGERKPKQRTIPHFEARAKPREHPWETARKRMKSLRERRQRPTFRTKVLKIIFR